MAANTAASVLPKISKSAHLVLERLLGARCFDGETCRVLLDSPVRRGATVRS